MARTMPTVLQTLINNVQAQTLAVNDFDADAPGWQNTTGVPNISAMAGANMIAFKKVPDGAYGITLDVARNAPVPVVDGDDIQMGKEELDALIGYCLHLAMFKQQGDEFQSSVAYVQDFFSLAMVRNSRLKAVDFSEDAIMDNSVLEEEKRPRRAIQEAQPQQQGGQ